MSMAERIYIAGPMTGLPEFNRPAFAAAAAHLRSLGLEAINPGELYTHTHMPWSFYMRAALRALLTCDSIFLLRGWTNSRGAKLEWQLANALGLTLYYEGSDFTPENAPAEGSPGPATPRNPGEGAVIPHYTENAGETWTALMEAAAAIFSETFSTK